ANTSQRIINLTRKFAFPLEEKKDLK
ncbi:unnamed protein product, partial [Oikopleura dioica]